MNEVYFIKGRNFKVNGTYYSYFIVHNNTVIWMDKTRSSVSVSEVFENINRSSIEEPQGLTILKDLDRVRSNNV